MIDSNSRRTSSVSGLTKSSLKGTILVANKCTIRLDNLYKKQLQKVPRKVVVKIESRLLVLARDGFLTTPFGKKIDNNLFEIRIHIQTQWRVLYAYLADDQVVLLSIFNKKTQKLPKREHLTAVKRLKKYL